MHRCPKVEFMAFCHRRRNRDSTHVYVKRTAVFRKDDQLFVSWTISPQDQAIVSSEAVSLDCGSHFSSVHLYGPAGPAGFKSSFNSDHGQVE